MNVLYTLMYGGEELSKKHETDAGIDLRALIDQELLPNETEVVSTGVKIEIPKGYFGMVVSRSSMALKEGVIVKNSPGIVDSDYRGDVGVILWNTNDYAYEIKKGQRIAQLIIMPYANEIDFVKVKQLSVTDRGEGGFGSTGK